MTDLDEFRTVVRGWAAAHAPTGWADTVAGEEDVLAVERRWLGTLRAAGYAAPHWAEPWGPGLDLARQVVLFEELGRAGAPYLRSFFVGLNQVYATLVEAGTDEQRERHLTRIAAGAEIWCQGFSEPEAGSDLASLRTRAVRDAGAYVLNGQKVWSSGAQHSDWCLLLARTDPDLPKRKGLSLFLLDLTLPGVEVRPIRQVDGSAHFCELFLTDVRVPATDLVGAEHDGWRIAQSTLSAERGPMVLELAERLETAFGWLVDLARAGEVDGAPAADDPWVQERIATVHADVSVLSGLCRTVVDDLVARGGAGPEASIIKVYYSELLQELMRLGTDLAGLDGQQAATRPLGSSWESGAWLLDYLNSWGMVSGGGTNHVQRNVIAERVLGLPREPVAT